MQEQQESTSAVNTQSVIYSLATLENVDCVCFDIRERTMAPESTVLRTLARQTDVDTGQEA